MSKIPLPITANSFSRHSTSWTKSNSKLIATRQSACQLAILAQRDIALTIAALASIKTWMVEAKQGRERAEEGGAISQEQLCLSWTDESKKA